MTSRSFCVFNKLLQRGAYSFTKDPRSGRSIAIKNSTSFLNVRLTTGDASNKDTTVDGRIATIPNLLCLARIGSAPILAYAILNEYYMSSLALFTVAAFTDLIDGYIARRFPSQASNLGSNLDPIADKILVGMLVLSLTYVDMFPLYLTALMLTKDALLMAGGAWIRYTTLPKPVSFEKFWDPNIPLVKMKPTLISKINTGIQFGAIAVALSSPLLGYVGHPHLDRLWYLTAATTVLSGLSYVFNKNRYDKV